MIHIGKPFICKENDRVKLVAKMVDEHQGIDENIYFETDATWGEYFVDEVSDAFLLNAIMPAVKYGEDIEVDGAVSEQLYYNLNRYIIPLLSATYTPPMCNLTHNLKVQSRMAI